MTNEKVFRASRSQPGMPPLDEFRYLESRVDAGQIALGEGTSLADRSTAVKLRASAFSC